jgi:hypothetical protein
MVSGSIGRSPQTALVARRPATDDTAWRIVSVATAPSAPAFGSFRSMMSAPPEIAISASATPVTLASILVISSESPDGRADCCIDENGGCGEAPAPPDRSREG